MIGSSSAIQRAVAFNPGVADILNQEEVQLAQLFDCFVMACSVSSVASNSAKMQAAL